MELASRLWREQGVKAFYRCVTGEAPELVVLLLAHLCVAATSMRRGKAHYWWLCAVCSLCLHRRGLTPTLVRAFPTYATTFFAYEAAVAWLDPDAAGHPHEH